MVGNRQTVKLMRRPSTEDMTALYIHWGNHVNNTSFFVPVIIMK